jgi:hypothetical protein
LVLGNSRPPGMTRIWKSASFSLVFGESAYPAMGGRHLRLGADALCVLACERA